MTDEQTTQAPLDQSDEYRAELIARANQMGIPFHPKAKNETIAAKIAAALKDQPIPKDPDNEEAAPEVVATETAPVETALNEAPRAMTGPSLVSAQNILSEGAKSVDKEVHPQKRLHRVIVTCNDPQKADQSGDMISVSNSQVGIIRFYCHFGKPWHVPEIVLNTMKEMQMLIHSSRKDGQERVLRLQPTYNIVHLAPLTEKELKRIQDKQTAALASED